jgi:DNA mismatch endonuclease, patch repair protein
MVDRLSKEHRSWNMSQIRSKNTAPELLLRSLLHRAGYRFRLHRKELQGRPDIVLAKFSTAIFVNGCYWHRHSGCKYATTPSTRTEFWKAKFQANVERDSANAEHLSKSGWNVITVWECELKSDPSNTLKHLQIKLEDNLYGP